METERSGISGQKLLLFDLDGTLTDPGTGITLSFQYALRRMGIEEDTANLYRVIGPPLLDSFVEFYGMTPRQARQAIGYYRERFGVRGLFENEVIPGIPELLMSLKAAGKRLAVATSKPTVYSVRILRRFGLEQYFELIVGSEFDGTRVRKEEVIAHILGRLNMPAGQCAMIGDRKHDMLGAGALGAESVGVLFGCGSPEELRESGANHIVRSPAELKALLLGGKEDREEENAGNRRTGSAHSDF